MAGNREVGADAGVGKSGVMMQALYALDRPRLLARQLETVTKASDHPENLNPGKSGFVNPLPQHGTTRNPGGGDLKLPGLQPLFHVITALFSCPCLICLVILLLDLARIENNLVSTQATLDCVLPH